MNHVHIIKSKIIFVHFVKIENKNFHYLHYVLTEFSNLRKPSSLNLSGTNRYNLVLDPPSCITPQQPTMFICIIAESNDLQFLMDTGAIFQALIPSFKKVDLMESQPLFQIVNHLH